MLKKILLVSLACILVAYIAFAIAFMNPKTDVGKECTNMKVEVACNSEKIYLNEAQILSYLKKANLDPVGKNLSEVRIEPIENALKRNKLIKKTKVYKTIDGSVKVEVFQRIPILRVMSDKGDYYLDNEGEIMPVPSNFSAYVPIATGNISEEYAKTQLYEFALFLQKNKFWNSQIEQVHITANKDVELVPRVGGHYVILGKIENYRENLDKLKLFYDKGLNKVGWSRYSIINLKFKDQVVCTKK
ncbi:hypothetical protein LJB92_03825 [Bacteroidales bacterium OttesenSCG-928-M06]|nr:hypothetical protein [Bacteroidales bacterium OttesenSCG-928-M06]